MTAAEVIALVAACVGILGTVVTMIFAFKNNHRTDSDEIAKRVEDSTRINVKLDEIISTMRDTKIELTDIKNELRLHDNRIIKVEESAKQAHHRLDTLEAKVDRRE